MKKGLGCARNKEKMKKIKTYCLTSNLQKEVPKTFSGEIWPRRGHMAHTIKKLSDPMQNQASNSTPYSTICGLAGSLPSNGRKMKNVL